MTEKTLHAGVKAALEFGPTIGFVAAYLLFRNERVGVAGVEYSGFVAVIAVFLPIFLIAMGGCGM